MIFARATTSTPADEADLASTLVGLEWDAEDHDENWMVSYADLISTLLAMVVLLFGRTAMTSETPPDPPSDSAIATTPVAESPLVAASETLAAPVPLPSTVPAPTPPPSTVPAPKPQDRLASLVESRFEGRIKAERRNEGLVLTIPEVALFDSARAKLQDSASPLLAELSATLREVGEAQISVEGHTDDHPVQGGEFESNWDLAAARANAVTRYLLERGFDPKRLHSVAFADTRPVADNGSAEGRAANRRVELKIEFGADSSG